MAINYGSIPAQLAQSAIPQVIPDSKELTEIEKSRSKRLAPRSAWKPGQSGNPSGKPKQIFGPSLRRKLKKQPELLNKVIEGIIAKAAGGSVAAFEAVADRVDGKPMQQIEQSGSVGIHVTVERVEYE